jgi:hypothetical protein
MAVSISSTIFNIGVTGNVEGPMSNEPEVSPKVRKRAAWLGFLAGAAVLILVWFAAEVLEPYLIYLSKSPGDVARSRVSPSGWANSDVWLLAETLSLAGLLFSGFVSKWLSPSRSWAAPGLLLAICLLYVVFAQFPATGLPWRIGIWSLGSLLAIVLGAWLGRRQDAV